MRDDFLAANNLGLIHLDWEERACIDCRAIVHIKPPKSADQANGAAGAVELESILRWLCEMRFAAGGGESGPSKVIPCSERSRLGEITGRCFAYRRLPVGCNGNGNSSEEAKKEYGRA
jgi:hypothetical protein